MVVISFVRLVWAAGRRGWGGPARPGGRHGRWGATRMGWACKAGRPAGGECDFWSELVG